MTTPATAPGSGRRAGGANDPDRAPQGHDTHSPDHDPGHDHNHEHGHDHGQGRTSTWSRLLHAVRPHSHDPAAATDSALESSAAGVRAVRISLLGLIATSAVQAAVVALSASVALLADTVHNLADALTALPLWLAFVLARRPASRRFGYGLGRVEDLAGVAVVITIAASAVVAAWQSIDRLAHPRPVTHLFAVGAAGVVGFAGNELVAVYRIRVGRNIGSAALVADGMHARADGITSLGVVLGAAGVALGLPLADPVVGLLITVAILVVLVGAARDIGHRLLDGVDPAMVERAEELLAAVPGVVTVRSVRLRWIGHELHGEAAIGVPAGLDVGAAHDLAHRAEERVADGIPRLRQVVVHVEPS